MTVNDFFRVAIFVDCNVEIVDNENWEKKDTALPLHKGLNKKRILT